MQAKGKSITASPSAFEGGAEDVQYACMHAARSWAAGTVRLAGFVDKYHGYWSAIAGEGQVDGGDGEGDEDAGDGKFAGAD